MKSPRATEKSAQKHERPRKGAVEKPVSLSPLTLEEALRGLLSIPDPEATKPKARAKPPARKAGPKK